MLKSCLFQFQQVLVAFKCFALASLDCVPVGITNSAVGLNIFAIVAGIKKYDSILKEKKKKKYDKVVLLRKDNLNSIEVLFSKALIDSYISHDEFISINNVLRKYYEMKKEIKNAENSVEYTIQEQKETYCISCKKHTANQNSSIKKIKQNRLILLSNCAVCGKKK